jgi:hypothetical protein
MSEKGKKVEISQIVIFLDEFREKRQISRAWGRADSGDYGDQRSAGIFG